MTAVDVECTKVLFLSTWYPYPPDNGSRLRVYHLLRALSSKHRVSLMSFAFDNAMQTTAHILHDWCDVIASVDANPFVTNRASDLRTFFSQRPVASRPVPAMSHLVGQALNLHKYDSVIASTGMMIDYALMTPPATARILEEHNAMGRWAWERYQQSTNTAQRLRRWLSWGKGRLYEARTYPRFDLITMVSEEDRQATVDAIGQSRTCVEVIPNGVDCTHNYPGIIDAQPNNIVFNGSLTYKANYDAMQWFLAEVWTRVRAHAPDVKLTITGSTTGVNMAGLALDDHVRLTGYVEDVRVPVAEATIAIAPIRQGGGTRLKILEAMALGTPVVATPKGAEGLNVVDGEHLLLAGSAERFAHSTIQILSDAALRQHLAANARRLVEEQYDWEQIGKRFVTLIEQTVGEVQARRQ